jgi:hypothetical protein
MSLIDFYQICPLEFADGLNVLFLSQPTPVAVPPANGGI